MLLDPAGITNPVEHIEFVLQNDPGFKADYWRAEARENSEFGSYTISVCKLNRDDLIERRRYHMRTVVRPQVRAIFREIDRQNIVELQYQLDRALSMFSGNSEFAALTYDAFRHLVPEAALINIAGRGWPSLSEVGRISP